MIDYSKTIDYLTEKARMSKATQSTIINTHATVIGNIYDNPELLK